MRCPFPPCHANVEPKTFRTDPKDATKTTTLVPIHDVEGPNWWFGRCPASNFRVPELTPHARYVLAQALKSFARQLATRIVDKTTGWEPAGIGSGNSIWQPDDVPNPTGTSKRPPPGYLGTDVFFPVRPAESEHDHIPNRGAMSSRDELLGMLNVAIEAASSCQEASAMLTNAMDAVDIAIERLAEQQQIGAAMTVAAIGGAEVGQVPEQAQRMLSSFSRLGELLIEQREVATLLRDRNEGCYRIAGRAVKAGEAYRPGI